MAKTFRLPKDEPLLNIASYARGGPRAGGRLTPSQIEQIRLTVNRAPEAVVKVLTRNSNDLRAVAKHIDYIGRRGNLELEGDDGERLRGRIGAALLDDWDLDIDDVRRQGGLAATSARKAPKIMHKIMFSMPPGTPPQKVLTAVRTFAREEFYGQHRYAMVLHTDEPHPHVHMILKAVSESGVRLNIKKATLRHWRSEFARHLRLLGVAANATERAVRGKSDSSKKDSIYRVSQRGGSTYMHAQAEAVAIQILEGQVRVDTGRRKLVDTRRQVVRGWAFAASALEHNGQGQLASKIWEFVKDMAPVRTSRERIASALLEEARPKIQGRTLLR